MIIHVPIAVVNGITKTWRVNNSQRQVDAIFFEDHDAGLDAYGFFYTQRRPRVLILVIHFRQE